MQLHYGFDNVAIERAVVTVGSFDGVHAGHHVLLRSLTNMAHRLCAESVVITFEPHPRIALGRAEGLRLLTTVEERAYLLAQYGVDRVVVATFDEAFRSQPYGAFVRDMLVGKLSMVGMVVGYNHRFGRGSEGSYEQLVPLSRELGFEVARVEQYRDEGAKISSTEVRKLLMAGDISRAVRLMQHPYIVIGVAQRGLLSVDDEYKLLPSDGRYRATVNGAIEDIEICDRQLRLNPEISGRVVVELC